LRRLEQRSLELEAQLKSRDASFAALQSELTALKLRALNSDPGLQPQHQKPTPNSRPMVSPKRKTLIIMELQFSNAVDGEVSVAGIAR
jgi:hypothetical protein